MTGVRWGIVGTGRMAAVMAAEITALAPAGHRLAAVASRRPETGRAFAQRHAVPHCCDSVAALAARPDVDAVYIATPHSRHAADMLACIEHGKAVLCEKPFTLDAALAAQVIAAARARGVFVMEAMWTRFLPAIVALRRMVADGAIGAPRLVIGGGAFIPEPPPGHYLLERALGGGVLLDAGVYLVSLASMLLGPPATVQASGSIGPTGVDVQDAILLGHAGGADALLYVSLGARRPPDLEILGSHGRIRVAAPVFRPEQLTLWTPGGGESVTAYPVDGSGYGQQLEAVGRALAAGERECAAMPLDETLSIMRTLDTVRARLGMTYPHETR